MKKFIATTMAVMLLVFAAAGQFNGNATSAAAAVETNTEISTMETNASSQIEVAPDIAYINTEISIIDESKTNAINSNKAATNALINALSAAGIPAKDIKTTGYYVSSFIDKVPVDPAAQNPVYKDVKKYQARSTFKVTVSKVAEVGDVLDRIAGVDNVNINNVTYALSSITAYKKEAINKAVALAKENLSFAAAAAGAKLFKLKTLSVDFNDNPYTPYPYYAKADAAGSVYQNPENLKISATVHMVYQVK